MAPTTINKCLASFPFGVLLLALSYAIFAVLVTHLAPECLDEPCNSEGIDNTTTGWATDFFVVAVTASFGLHLLYARSSRNVNMVLLPGVLVQISMSMAYVFGGVAHLSFPNSGADDDKGQVGFYIVWICSFFFLTLSLFCQLRWAMARVAMEPNQNLFPASSTSKRCFVSCSTRCALITFFLLNVTAFLIIAAGCTSCLAQPDLHTPDIIDSFEPTDSDPLCVSIIFYGEAIWYVSCASFWIPFAVVVLRNVVVNHEPTQVWGLSTWIATISLPIVQFTIGFMYIVWVSLLAIALDRDSADFYKDAKGAVVYHFGIILTMLLSHNLSLAYGEIAEEKEDEFDVEM